MPRIVLLFVTTVLLATSGCSAESVELLTAADLPDFDNPAPTARIPYGNDPLQFGDLRVPDGDGPHPVAIFVHGGCWLSQYDISHTDMATDALTRNGIATWSLEYRRVGDPGGGWPGTFEDVGQGADHLRSIADQFNLDLDRVIAMGHSAGGHLAIWLAARSSIPADTAISVADPLPVSGVLALTPAPDLGALYEAQVCGQVIDGLMGGSPEDVPDRYRWGDPTRYPGIDVPQRIITGKHDSAWAPNGRLYFDAAAARGDDIELIEAPESGHFEVIYPGSSTWPLVLEKASEMLDPD
jgi:acetyl esterase/lipase